MSQWAWILLSLFLAMGCDDNDRDTGNSGPASVDGGETDAGLALTDNQIVKLVMTANTGEAMMADLAPPRASLGSVQAFASRMIADHTMANEMMMALVQQQSLMPTASAQAAQLDAEASQTMAMLMPLSGGDFDRAYIDAQVKAHTEVLGLFDNLLLPDSMSPAVRDALQMGRSMVADHLSQAQQIQGSLSSTGL